MDKFFLEMVHLLRNRGSIKKYIQKLWDLDLVQIKTSEFGIGTQIVTCDNNIIKYLQEVREECSIVQKTRFVLSHCSHHTPQTNIYELKFQQSYISYYSIFMPNYTELNYCFMISKEVDKYQSKELRGGNHLFT